MVYVHHVILFCILKPEGWNILLNNEFRMYGPRVIYYLIYKTDLNGNIIEENPMDSVFPKNSDCN